MDIQIIANNSDLIPFYATDGASGADLFADIPTPIEISPHKSILVPTGVRVMMPYGIEAQVRSRSGLAAKNQIFVLNSPGTIDADYHGEIKVILFNLGENSFTVNPKDRIAQLVFSPIIKVNFQQVTTFSTVTSRGEQGFGHTGINNTCVSS